MKYKSLFTTVAAMFIMAAIFISSSFAIHTQPAAAFPTPEPAATSEPIDWKDVMVNAVCHADDRGGLEAQYALGGAIKYDDLYLLAKIIARECGPN